MDTNLTVLFLHVLHIPLGSCYLVTFYFTHQLLPQLKGKGMTAEHQSPNTWTSKSNSMAFSPEEEEVIGFVKTFGAYLKLHTSLICASDAGSGVIIRTLLDMARFDLRHREFLKGLSNQQTFLLYEPVSLASWRSVAIALFSLKVFPRAYAVLLYIHFDC